MIPVTLITKNATQDTLTAQDYKEIFEELRQHHSLRAFVELAKSSISIAWWSRYERGEAPITRPACSDLRRAVGLPALPPTILESVADADPDAEVIEIGESSEPVKRLLKLRTTQSLSISANGVVTARPVACTGRTKAIRKRLRREMTTTQAQVWDKLSNEERDRVLGL